MLKMTTRTPTTLEYNPSGTEIRVHQCRSRCLSRPPTVRFSTPMPATLPPKARLPSQGTGIMVTTPEACLTMIPSIGCTPKSINRGELGLGLHLLLSLPLPTTGKAPWPSQDISVLKLLCSWCFSRVNWFGPVV